MRPLFIFGSDEGSQAFVSALLASHRDCVETPPFSASYLRAARSSIFGILAEPEFAYDAFEPVSAPTTPEGIGRLVEAYAHDHGRGDAVVWLEPVAHRALHLLADAFPEARFLHLVQDGRAVAAARWRKAGEGRNPGRAARRWQDQTRLSLAAERDIGASRCLRVSYEALLSDLTRGLGALTSFIGLPPDGFRIVPSVLDKDYRPHLYGWRTELTLHELRSFEAVGGALLTELGYGLELTPSGLPARPDIWHRAGRPPLPRSGGFQTPWSRRGTAPGEQERPRP